jgi:uncharacterized protein with HEPN domain
LLMSDDTLRDAIVNVVVTAEAATRLPPETQAQFPTKHWGLPR